MAPLPTVESVAAYAGRSSTVGVAPHLVASIALVRSYTRGVGFEIVDEVPDAIVAVIVGVATRSVSNPEALRSEAIDGGTLTTTRALVGQLSWLEQVTLARYRQRMG